MVVARQINSIRNYFLNNTDGEIDFIKYNKLYVDPNYPPAFHLSSTHARLFILVAILNGGFGGAGSYFVINYFFNSLANEWTWTIIGLVFIVLSIIQMYFAAYSLRKKDYKQLKLDNSVQKSSGA